MAKSYCLTIEVKSDHIENGLGYMVAFRLPPGIHSPAEAKDFSNWSEEVRKAVLTAGDLPFHADNYTRKLALAELMHDLDTLNKKYDIQIGFIDHTPALQIRSTNPFDKEISADFEDEAGHFTVTETSLADRQQAKVEKHGKMAVVEGLKTKDFPFKKAPHIQPKKRGAHMPFRL